MTAELEKRIAELEAENERLKRQVDVKSRIAARALASYQQRALHMEIIRQQNEDLDRLAVDLAKSKRVEEERAREIEAAARLKSEFLANFSHEIRTPLNGIIGYCDLLSREEGSRLTPHGRRDLNVVKANARTLLSLINDILDLSKIEAGRVDVVKETVEIEPIIEDCVANARDRLKGKEVDIIVNLADEAKILETDGLKLRQILMNLLTNAAKFTETGEIVVEASARGSTLVLMVEDTGIGMPADQLPFIFEKFRQVDGSATRKIGGTGLGLAIVRELSRLLGGRVDVTSTLGKGTRFTVTLDGVIDGAEGRPVSARDSSRDSSRDSAREAPAAAPTASEPGAGAALVKGATVLLVDDDVLIQQLVRGQLEEEGFTVLVADDGVSALTIIREKKPAAVILDIHLPKLDGWQVLSEIKSHSAIAGTPVIILSVEEQRSRGYSLGAVEYLVKPVEPEHLVATVRKAIAPGSGEVLIVDDDSSMRELVARHLRRAGFSAAEAATGEEALMRARISPPALLVLDLMMPGMSGFEVLRELRAARADVPVVVLTGKSLEEQEVNALRSGLAQVVHKGGLALESVVREAKRVLIAQRALDSKKKLRILYVEDSPQNRDIVRRYLSGVFEVIEAEDGEHGLERAKRDQPDLILMDLSLPRIDGWEATRRLKADGELGAIPVIALTAHAGREELARAREAGAGECLTKPVERDTLLSTIRRFLQDKVTHG